MDVAGRLRDEGYRMTVQRQLVWDVLRRAEHHLTAEEIHDQVRRTAPDLNLASVYRTLGLLSDLGLARESQLGANKGHWEIAHPDDEFHLVCRVCGEIDHHEGDLVEQVREHLGGGHGFVAEDVDLVVHGVCARCRPAPPDTP